jgi:hypothetical protein
MVAIGWGEPCCAYNLHLRLDERTRRSLSAVQDAIESPALLRVPEHALHISVAWLLPVHQEFAQAKETLWREHGPSWQSRISQVLAGFPPFRLTYHELLATETAIIALAQPRGVVNAVRAELAAALDLPWELCRGELVHTTLFRYREETARVLDRPATSLDFEFRVQDVCLVREDAFPSLRSELLGRYRLD